MELWKLAKGIKGLNSLTKLRPFAAAPLLPITRPLSSTGLSGFTLLTGVTLLLTLTSLFTAPAYAVTTATRASAFEYDAASGLLTKEIIEPDDPNLCLVTSYTYDSFGNKLTATTRNCNGTAGANAPTNTEAAAPPATVTDDSGVTNQPNPAIIVSRTSSTTYDAQGRFAISSTNALSQTETKTYNADYGTVASLTGPNGLTTSWTYDSFGRPLSESRADGTSTTTAYALCDASCPTNGNYTVTKTQAGAPTSVTTYDMHYRAIQSTTPDKDGTLIYARTQYDKLGRTIQSSRPYKAGGTPVWTSVTYDTIGRPLTSTAPDTTITSSAYAGYTTVTTNAKSQTRTEIKNSQGQLVTVTDTQAKSLTYQYDAFGNLTKTTDVLGNITTITYDKRGRKVAMNDPDQGAWTYAYDALGQLKRQKDAKLQVVTFAYDILGRMTQRNEPDLVSKWYYDTCDATLNPAGKCIGKPTRETSDNGSIQLVAGNPGYIAGDPKKYQVRLTLYDALGRPTGQYDSIDATTLSTGFGVTKSYDSLGRVSQLAYPNSFGSSNVYSANGYLIEVRKTSDNSLYWQATGLTDAEGRITQYKYGNNIVTNMTFDSMGRTQTISAGGGAGVDQTLGNTSLAGAASVTNQSFVFDSLGNLTQRYDGVTNLNEAFAYDSLNRLTSTSAQAGTGPLTQTTLTYNAIGNIITKSDIGTYTYASLKADGSSRPHAVSKIMMNDGTTVYNNYTYDANGNLLTGKDASGKGLTLTWNSWNMAASVVGNKPATSTPGLSASTPISTSSSTFTVVYNSAHERVKEVLPDGTTIYNVSPRVDTGIHVEKRIKGNTTTYVYSLYAGSMPFGTYTTITPSGSATTTQTSYFHTDHLGSLVAISDQAGNVTQRRSYDAWGKKRNLNGTTFANAFVTPNERHGFTGHEEWDEVGLINMNGRLYDPAIGRFMSADPTIQFPDDMQNYNRYSYVNNNPLSLIDRSGFGLFGFIKHVVKGIIKGVKHLLQNKIVRLAIAIYVGYQLGFGFDGYGLFGAGGPLGAVSLTANAITIGALNGAAAGFASSFIMSGGNLKAGLAGAFTGAIGGGIVGYYGGSYPFSRVVVSSVANGVSAKIQGGNFIDGLKSGLATSFAAFGLGAATEYTDGLKKLACSQPDARPCVDNRWGELLTDGGRDIDYPTYNPNKTGNWFTNTGMAFEGSAAHYYDENGYIGRFINYVSKVHDFQNSWNYSATTGFYMSRGAAFDTIFQAYSFAGMLPAAAFTGAALLDGRSYITSKIR